MDKLTLRNMSFHAFHGDFVVERKFGQLFEIDVEIYFDSRPAGRSDRIADTIDLNRIYEIVGC